MTITPTGVTQAVQRSGVMGHVADHLQAARRQQAPDDSRLEWTADGRRSTSVEETIHLLPDKPEPVLSGRILHKVAGVGRMHASQPFLSFS